MSPTEYGELAIPLEEEILTEEDIHCFARLGSIELLKFGNTCANELGLVPMETTALAFDETGLRGILAPDVSDIAEGGGGQADTELKKRRFEAEQVAPKRKQHSDGPRRQLHADPVHSRDLARIEGIGK